jgi:hypothetical protein
VTRTLSAGVLSMHPDVHIICYRRARRMWIYMRTRLSEARSNSPRRQKRYKAYADVEMRISREDFVEWAIPEIAKWIFSHDENPTIDRIDSHGHYEIGNLQLATLKENAAKRRKSKNIFAPDGQAWCSSCRKYKKKTRFYADNRTDRASGVASYCIACVNKRKPDRSKNFERRRLLISSGWKKSPYGTFWISPRDGKLFTLVSAEVEQARISSSPPD